jgi:hypothetical protein
MKIIYIVKVFVGDTKDDYVVNMKTPHKCQAVDKVKRNLKSGLRSQLSEIKLQLV